MKKKILIISPHPDDETLGAGGYISRAANDGHEIKVLTVSGHLPPLYEEGAFEITKNEALKAYKTLGVNSHKFLMIPATMVGDEPTSSLNQKIYNEIADFGPSVVLCPFPDRHVDHRVIFESTMVATRPVSAGKGIELLAAFETLSETHWNAPYIEPNFNHNLIVDISNFIEKKLDALRAFESQIDESTGPRSIEAVKALSKFRGSQAGYNYGEAFYIIRQRY